MIFVTLGSQDKAFPRIMEELDRLIKKGIIKDNVIAQIGSTKFSSKNIKTFIMSKSKEEYLEYINKSDLVITHGGVGSIYDAITNDKKVIAVPRYKKYKECANDHQIQIIHELVNQGYIMGVDSVSQLEEAIKKVKAFKPKKYISDNTKLISTIENYIDNGELK